MLERRWLRMHEGLLRCPRPSSGQSSIWRYRCFERRSGSRVRKMPSQPCSVWRSSSKTKVAGAFDGCVARCLRFAADGEDNPLRMSNWKKGPSQWLSLDRRMVSKDIAMYEDAGRAQLSERISLVTSDVSRWRDAVARDSSAVIEK